MKEELKYITTTLGELFAMIFGAKLTPIPCVGNLDIPEQLHSTIMLSLVKGLVPFGWTMFNVLLMILALETVHLMDMLITTVNTEKMFL